MQDSNLHQLVVKSECRNTHHKLVMNSLKRLTCPDADAWCRFFTRHFSHLLEGSKDPDTKFRDFRNHVIHVSENYWGGANTQAEKWYQRLVLELKAQNWTAVAYSAGVLSHYYMDPVMPLHTGQTEEEGVIHRAAVWSVNKSFNNLIQLLETSDGYPDVQIPKGDQNVTKAVYEAAEFGHQYYDDFIDHYNLEAGSKNPPAGLDSHLQQVTSRCLGYASVGFARLLESAIKQASTNPPSKSNALIWSLYKVTAPISWLANFALGRTRTKQVRRIHKEFQETGKVVDALPKDEKQVRENHANEILNISIHELDRKPIGRIGSKYTPDHTRKSIRKRTEAVFRLNPDSELESAPSIGKKTADRFQQIGIVTVAQFLGSDAQQMADQLNTPHITADSIRTWKTQTRLACQIPNIYGHDAQIMVGCGFETPAEVAACDVESILQLVDEYGKTKESEFVMRGKIPDHREITNWIAWSQKARKIA